MNLQQIKDTLKTICLSHKQIVDFGYGEDFLISTIDHDFPMAFLEIPYSLDYDLNSQFKTYTFALLILMNPTYDDLVEDHSFISEAESIGDAIATKLQREFKTLGVRIESLSGISLREFSDDNCSGVRYDITIKTFRENCYESNFN